METKRDIKEIDINFIVEKILLFAEILSGLKFYPYQKEIGKRLIESVVLNDGEEITVLFGRQMGKSEIIADVSNAMAVLLPSLAKIVNDEGLKRFEGGIWIGIFAPISGQSRVTFDRMRLRLSSKRAKEVLLDPELRIEFVTNNGNTIILNNGSLISAMSASETSHIKGRTYHLIILEEAQEISNFKIKNDIHPMGSAHNATITKIGTAWTYRGNFYETIQRNKRTMIEGEIKNHFEYDYEEGAKYNTKYKEYVEKEKTRLGYDSDEFKMNYRLLWVLERGMFIIPEELDALALEHSHIVNEKKGSYQVAGIDFAKTQDSTVVTIVEVDVDNPIEVSSEKAEVKEIKYKKRILNWLEIFGDDYEAQFYQTLDFLNHYDVKIMYVDATGVGDPVCDRLVANLPHINVYPFKFSMKSKDEIYRNLAIEMKGKRVFYPASSETKKTRTFNRFYRQFVDLEKEYKGRWMNCEAPKKDRDAHDDFCDSLALAIMAASQEEMPEISEVENPFFK